ncbi:DUF2442 domain-containing protein [Propionivibrio sp.]|uniref:DUF2442 domain-containing protein n=1 Tax=Propionivibrio sp. TaxID=2212460 RepID=UPI003BEF88E0
MNTSTTLPKPTAVSSFSDYTLKVTFNNGEIRIFNATPYLAYPAFEPLKAISLFMQARIAHNTVVWNEEVDMAPESLYLESTPV